MENKTIIESIYDFEHHKRKLEEKEPDDLSDEAINLIYQEISVSAQRAKKENA